MPPWLHLMLESLPSLLWAGLRLHHPADAAVLRARPGVGFVAARHPAVRAAAARGCRPLLRLDHPRHAAAGAALPDLLRPAQRRHRARCLSGGADRLHAQCRRLYVRDHPRRAARSVPKGQWEAAYSIGMTWRAGDAPHHPAAGRAASPCRRCPTPSSRWSRTPRSPPRSPCRSCSAPASASSPPPTSR